MDVVRPPGAEVDEVSAGAMGTIVGESRLSWSVEEVSSTIKLVMPIGLFLLPTFVKKGHLCFL